jgi:serine/threonine protein kinase
MSLVSTDSPMLLGPGSRLDRYELLSLLGQGGMGAVWLARLMAHLEFKKVVAVKTLLPQFASDPRFRGMFLDEARITSRLDHGNVVQTLELGEFGGWLYQAMEWVDGDSLRTLMMAMDREQQRMPPAIGLRIIADACAGVHSAHELRDRGSGELLDVVHRDISPHNILVCTNGITKVADFGIAKAKGRCSPETTSGDVKGKIAYMAPEQALGEDIDRRADVWALGCILYELLCGRKVFESSNQIEMLQKLISTAPTLTFDEQYPEQIVSIVQRALRPHREARFETAGDMERAIRIGCQNAGLSADADDIARLYSKYLGVQAKQRAMTVELALEAAEQRQRLSITLSAPVSSAAAAPAVPRPNQASWPSVEVRGPSAGSLEDDTSTASDSVLLQDATEDEPVPEVTRESVVEPVVDPVGEYNADAPLDGLEDPSVDIPTQKAFEPAGVSDDSKETLVTGSHLNPVFAASLLETKQPRTALSVIMAVSAVLLVIVLALAGVVTRRGSAANANASATLSSAVTTAAPSESVAQPNASATAAEETDFVVDPQPPASGRAGPSAAGGAAASKPVAGKPQGTSQATGAATSRGYRCKDPDCLDYPRPGGQGQKK